MTGWWVVVKNSDKDTFLEVVWFSSQGTEEHNYLRGKSKINKIFMVSLVLE